jgi:four helix bundle protein
MSGFVDEWILGLLDCWIMEYTIRRNLNRGYMKLEVWQRGMDLFEMAYRLASAVPDFKLRSQFTDAAQSVSANIAEGYGRRTLPEYLQFLYTAKGSLAEALTRTCGLWGVGLVSADDFEKFDQLHYEVENKLLSLISSLESKRGTGEWQDALPRSNNPTTQRSTNHERPAD